MEMACDFFSTCGVPRDTLEHWRYSIASLQGVNRFVASGPLASCPKSSREGCISMPEDQPFQDFIRRLRAGEPKAIEELLRTFEEFVRKRARSRLAKAKLQAVFDSSDISQEVFKSFAIRVANGEYSLQNMEDLEKLLATMSRNKFTDLLRKELAERRDIRREVPLSPEAAQLVSPDPTPSQQAAHNDLRQQILDRLPAAEKRLAELRFQRKSWPEIAAELGGASDDALRQQLNRAMKRIAKELGLDQLPEL
jgi:RNA polymerase sigma factor (sigma-70 family)